MGKFKKSLHFPENGSSYSETGETAMHVEDIWILLTLNMSRSFCGHLVHFSQNSAVAQKGLIVELNG